MNCCRLIEQKESKISRIGAGKELDSDEEFSDDDKPSGGNDGKSDKSDKSDDAKFREAFDPKSKSYHGGQTIAVPMGGQRVPESMGGAAAADWMSLPEVQSHLINESYGMLC
jgi:hypothetical protein